MQAPALQAPVSLIMFTQKDEFNTLNTFLHKIRGFHCMVKAELHTYDFSDRSDEEDKAEKLQHLLQETKGSDEENKAEKLQHLFQETNPEKLRILVENLTKQEKRFLDVLSKLYPDYSFYWGDEGCECNLKEYNDFTHFIETNITDADYVWKEFLGDKDNSFFASLYFALDKVMNLKETEVYQYNENTYYVDDRFDEVCHWFFYSDTRQLVVCFVFGVYTSTGYLDGDEDDVCGDVDKDEDEDED